jgi:hypothetical protein
MTKNPLSAGPTAPARSRWIRLALGALALSTLVAGGGLRQDELDCEQAVAHLQECCPDFGTATIACVSSRGCDVSEPALSIQESQCVIDRACADLVASGLCAATHDLESPHEDDTGTLVTHPPVCL